MTNITYVTGNYGKYISVKEYFKKEKIGIDFYKFNLEELEINDIEKISKKKVLDAYMYDLGSCTFCQLCVEGCPTKAIEFTNDFEQAVFTRSKLVKQLNKK